MDYYTDPTPDPDLAECFGSPGGRDLIADVFLPDKAARNGAAVVFVHGGGWNGGSRHQFRWHAHRLSRRGYLACTIDYRLTKEATFPAAVEDCQAAVRWVRHEADRFGIEPDRVAAFGSSAGGHLVACLGVLDHQVDGLSSRVDGVVDVHGVHDFIAQAADVGGVREPWQAFIGGSLEEKREQWEQASPARHVDEHTAPMLLVHDPSDGTVPYKQSVLLADALVKAGRPMQFVPSPGSGHGFVYSPCNPWTQKVWPAAVTWLDQCLIPRPVEDGPGPAPGRS